MKGALELQTLALPSVRVVRKDFLNHTLLLVSDRGRNGDFRLSLFVNSDCPGSLLYARAPQSGRGLSIEWRDGRFLLK